MSKTVSEKISPPIPRNSHRFQKSGSEAVYEVMETKESVIYRVDMPGCPESDLVYWVDGDKIHCFADEPAMPEYDHDGRRYGGTMVFNTDFYDAKNAEAKLRDGVLWLTVPKIPGKNIKLNVIDRVMHLNIITDDVV